MAEKRVHIYNGDIHDTADHTSDKFLAVNSCGIHSNANQRTIRTRGRHDYHLLYVESGEMIIDPDGTGQVVLPGGFAIYPPSVKQDYVNRDGGTYWVHFTGARVEELLTDAKLLNLRVYQGKKHEPAVARIFEKMLFHYASRSSLRDLMLCADLISLITEIGRFVQSDCEPYGDERLRPIILSMNKYYAKEIDLETYAKMAGLSRGRFLHLFKEAMGISPYAYVLDLRLSRAAELLLSTEEPISSIAFSVGFSDPLYFSRLFKKKYQQSPESFRKGERERP